MTALVVKLAVRVLLFGVVLAYAARHVTGVRVEPRKALAWVALVVALLNAFAYTLLSTVLNLVTLGMFFFLVPFVANGLLLYAADRFLTPLRIDGIVPLAKLAALMTLLHLVLQLLRM